MKKKHHRSPSADARAVILERGHSESWIAKVGKLESLKAFRPAVSKWLASDSEFGIVTAPMHIPNREEIPEAIRLAVVNRPLQRLETRGPGSEGCRHRLRSRTLL
jgi:hypothetical protein